MPNLTTKILAAAFLALSSNAALAHTGHGASGLAAGLAHPFSGFDHTLAMLAVGLWAAQNGRGRLWLLPAAFMITLAAGACTSMIWQHPLPALEAGIALSVLALGLMIAFFVQLPIWQNMTIIAPFGLLHGYAHGLELPQSATPAAYILGFLAATTVLHLTGIAASTVFRQKPVALATIAGGSIAMSGFGLLAFS